MVFLPFAQGACAVFPSPSAKRGDREEAPFAKGRQSGFFSRLLCVKGAVCHRQTEGLFCGCRRLTAFAVEAQTFGLLLGGTGLRLSPSDRLRGRGANLRFAFMEGLLRAPPCTRKGQCPLTLFRGSFVQSGAFAGSALPCEEHGDRKNSAGFFHAKKPAETIFRARSYIQLGRDVDLIGNVFSVLFSLADAFG